MEESAKVHISKGILYMYNSTQNLLKVKKNVNLYTQLTFTCPKARIEILEKDVKYVRS